MPAFHLPRQSSTKAAALIIVLAFVVLLTGLSLAFFSRTTGERQLAHSSYHDTSADLLARTVLDVVVTDLRREIVDGSTAYVQNDGTTVYIPKDTSSGAAANMVPQRSGNSSLVPNLIRRSVANDQIPFPGQPCRASGVSSAPLDPANPKRGDITRARWNRHYLIPKANTTDDGTDPIAAFIPPDWVFVTDQGPAPAPTLANVVGRYAYAVYAEGGLLDMNVAGYPTNTTVTQSGRKGSLAYADLTALGNYPIPNGSPSPAAYQVDKLVGWRNYATTRPIGSFPTNFATNFQTDPTRAAAYFTWIISNTNGFLSPSTTTWNIPPQTDQMFVQRQELLAFRATTGFSSNALQYLSTFTRETNAPSFSPSTPQGSTIDYAALANTATAVNPNFLLRRVTNIPTGYKRFDGTTPTVGEPLVKNRFPLSRLAWVTYKGPSATLAATDPVYQALFNAGVSTTTISTGTANNIKRCFGLTFGGNAGDQWTYTNPNGSSAATRILRLDEVAAAGREADFFELLQAGILSGSLGQNTAPPPGTSGGGVTGGSVWDVSYMSNSTLHILSIGAAIIDQADPDSVPTRIQFNPSGTAWTAYGVESLPYISQMYPIAGTSPDDSSKWATYLLFQLWNPHQNVPASPPSVRLRVDGNIGIFSDGGNSLTWDTSTNKQTFLIPTGGVSVTLNPAFSFSAPAPLTNTNTTNAAAAPGPPAGGAFSVFTAPPVP